MSSTWAVPIAAENAQAEPRKKAKVVLGIDPGKGGACVALSLVSDEAKVWRLRYKEIGGVYVLDLGPVVRVVKAAAICFIERVDGRGGWGARQNFALGSYFGAASALAANAGWEVRFRTVHQWHKGLGIPSAKAVGKEKSKAAYRRLYPQGPLPHRMNHYPQDGTIDALLIASEGVLSLGHKLRKWRFE